MNDENLIVGIGGHAVGINLATGTEIWRVKLKGSNFVTIHQAGSHVLAGAGGVLFCLEAATGQIVWKNQLKGLGTGLISFVSGDAAAAAEFVKRRNAEAAAAAAAGS
jgi:outer membrane protein assembly factor BamB